MIRRLNEAKRANNLVPKIKETVDVNKTWIEDCISYLESIQETLDIIVEESEKLYNTPVSKGLIDVLPIYYNTVDSVYDKLHDMVYELQEIESDTVSLLD